MRELLFLSGAILTGISVSCGAEGPDSIPPASVSDLQAAFTSASSLDLKWTAPGDDEDSGQAWQYEVRYSSFPLTDSTWSSATLVDSVPRPQPAGRDEVLSISGLLSGHEYHFSVRTADEVPHWSGLSNVASVVVRETEDPPSFVLEWGSGYLVYSADMAISSDGFIYVANTDRFRIEKFDVLGQFVSNWGGFGIGEGEFLYPRAIGVSADGHVYVGDTAFSNPDGKGRRLSSHRIQKFSADGTFATEWGSPGSGDGQFRTPIGIAVASDGNVFVADSGNARIQKFSADGVFLTKWGDLGLSGVAIYEDLLYIAEPHRVLKFDLEGNFILQWGSPGSGDGQFEHAKDLAVDAQGDVFVADSDNYRVQKFDSNGSFLTKWGTKGAGPSEFSHPWSVECDHQGSVYVLDWPNSRILKFH
jgi:DNA-binding beta-propeller fold protein YncE